MQKINNPRARDQECEAQRNYSARNKHSRPPTAYEKAIKRHRSVTVGRFLNQHRATRIDPSRISGAELEARFKALASRKRKAQAASQAQQPDSKGVRQCNRSQQSTVAQYKGAPGGHPGRTGLVDERRDACKRDDACEKEKIGRKLSISPPPGIHTLPEQDQLPLQSAAAAPFQTENAHRKHKKSRRWAAYGDPHKRSSSSSSSGGSSSSSSSSTSSSEQQIVGGLCNGSCAGNGAVGMYDWQYGLQRQCMLQMQQCQQWQSANYPSQWAQPKAKGKHPSQFDPRAVTQQAYWPQDCSGQHSYQMCFPHQSGGYPMPAMGHSSQQTPVHQPVTHSTYHNRNRDHATPPNRCTSGMPVGASESSRHNMHVSRSPRGSRHNKQVHSGGCSKPHGPASGQFEALSTQRGPTASDAPKALCRGTSHGMYKGPPGIHDLKESMPNLYMDPNERGNLMCANPSCNYLVNKDPMHGMYCCKRCHFQHECPAKGIKHGYLCTQEVAPPTAKRAPPCPPSEPLGQQAQQASARVLKTVPASTGLQKPSPSEIIETDDVEMPGSFEKLVLRYAGTSISAEPECGEEVCESSAHPFVYAAHRQAGLVAKWRAAAKPRKSDRRRAPPAIQDVDVEKVAAQIDKWLDDRGVRGQLVRDSLNDNWLAFTYVGPRQQAESGVPPEHAAIAYHGTWWYATSSILYTGVLLESCDETRGHEFWVPGVFCSPNLETARQYARPQIVFDDGTYHRVVFKLQVDLRQRKKTRAKGGVQWVFPWQAVVIVTMLVQINAPPEKGEERLDQWDADMEAHPPGQEVPVSGTQCPVDEEAAVEQENTSQPSQVAEPLLSPGAFSKAAAVAIHAKKAASKRAGRDHRQRQPIRPRGSVATFLGDDNAQDVPAAPSHPSSSSHLPCDSGGTEQTNEGDASTVFPQTYDSGALESGLTFSCPPEPSDLREKSLADGNKFSEPNSPNVSAHLPSPQSPSQSLSAPVPVPPQSPSQPQPLIPPRTSSHGQLEPALTPSAPQSCTPLQPETSAPPVSQTQPREDATVVGMSVESTCGEGAAAPAPGAAATTAAAAAVVAGVLPSASENSHAAEPEACPAEHSVDEHTGCSHPATSDIYVEEHTSDEHPEGLLPNDQSAGVTLSIAENSECDQNPTGAKKPAGKRSSETAVLRPRGSVANLLTASCGGDSSGKPP